MGAEDQRWDVDPMEDVDDSEVEIEERVCQINDIVDQIGIKHPIIYDIYDLCQYYKNDKLRPFNISMLKAICGHFEIPFKSRDRKSDLILKVGEIISELYNCMVTLYTYRHAVIVYKVMNI